MYNLPKTSLDSVTGAIKTAKITKGQTFTINISSFERQSRNGWIETKLYLIWWGKHKNYLPTWISDELTSLEFAFRQGYQVLPRISFVLL